MVGEKEAHDGRMRLWNLTWGDFVVCEGNGTQMIVTNGILALAHFKQRKGIWSVLFAMDQDCSNLGATSHDLIRE